MKASEELIAKIRTLPDAPGVYQYFDKDAQLIYVGKAKSLRKRVSSYFTKKDGVDRKTLRLVLSIRDIKYTVVNSEYEALLLENNLIKQNQPRYNINLRDDKSYPYLLITKDKFPKIYPTRRRIKGAGTYFGPYASVKTMNVLLDMVRKLFPFRTCNLPLTPENIAQRKWKVCLEFHLGNCKGPCEAHQSEQEYKDNVAQAARVLRGNLGPAKAWFREQMQMHAQNMAFEKAQQMKARLEMLEKYEAKSTVVNPDLGDLDVFAILSDGEAYVNYLQVREGMVVHTHTLELKKQVDEEPAELLQSAILELRTRFSSDAREIISNTALEYPEEGVRVSVPQIGDKKKLVDLSVKNILYYKHDREARKVEAAENKPAPGQRVLLKLQQDLRLKEYPDHIECFDNSNTQGTEPVAAMVCFKNGVPSKRDYRHFLVKTVVGPDDFASMREIVGRRYRRVLEEQSPLPKLIIIDGGKGQLGAAVESLKELDLYGKIPIVGIAKRLEEIYYPEDPYPLHLDKKGESLMLIQRIRDEAHRFGITHHRDRRSKASLKLSAEEVEGIGPKTMEKVQLHFKSLKQITVERLPELERLIGKKKADALALHLKLLVPPAPPVADMEQTASAV